MYAAMVCPSRGVILITGVCQSSVFIASRLFLRGCNKWRLRVEPGCVTQVAEMVRSCGSCEDHVSVMDGP